MSLMAGSMTAFFEIFRTPMPPVAEQDARRLQFLQEAFKGPADSICLRLPWGDVRNFMVPARNPSNPVYWTRPREARQAGKTEAIRIDTARYEASLK